MKNKTNKKKIKAAAAISAVVLTTVMMMSGPAIIADTSGSDDPLVFLDDEPVIINLTATDNVGGSGVDYTMVQIAKWTKRLILPEWYWDDTYYPLQEYTGDIEISELGLYNITYYSVDIAGNEEDHKYQEFKIEVFDITPPTTTCNLTGHLKT